MPTKQDNHQIHDNWDTLCKVCHQSHMWRSRTAASPEQILAKLASWPKPSPLYFRLFGILLANTYLGIGQRALELGLETVKNVILSANQITYDQDKTFVGA